MMITIYPKRELEAKWEEDKKLFCPAAGHPPLCLRCGRKLDEHLMEDAPQPLCQCHGLRQLLRQ